MRTVIEETLLDAFLAFCTNQGWERVPTVGEWELVRMRHPDRDHPALIHFRKRRSLGVTLHGESAALWKRFERSPEFPR